MTLARPTNVKENARQGTSSERREMEKGRRERKVQSEKFDKERQKLLGMPAWTKARKGGDKNRCVATKRQEKTSREILGRSAISAKPMKELK